MKAGGANGKHLGDVNESELITGIALTVAPLACISRNGPLRPLTVVRNRPLYRFSSASTGAPRWQPVGPGVISARNPRPWNQVVYGMSALPVKSIE